MFSGHLFILAAVMILLHLFQKLSPTALIIYFAFAFLLGVASKLSIIFHPAFSFFGYAIYERILLGGYYVDDVIALICIGFLIRHIKRAKVYQAK